MPDDAYEDWADAPRHQARQAMADLFALCETEAAGRGDLDAVPVWAGEALDLITGVDSAADIVARLVAETETALARATGSAGPA